MLRLCIFLLLTIGVFSQIKNRTKSSNNATKKNDNDNVIRYLKKDSIFIERLDESKITEGDSDFDIDDSKELLINEMGSSYYSLEYDPNDHNSKTYFYFTFFTKDNDLTILKLKDKVNNKILYTKKTKNVYIGKLTIKQPEHLEFIFENSSTKPLRLVVGFGCQNCSKGETVAKNDSLEITRNRLMQIQKAKSQILYLSNSYSVQKGVYVKSINSSHQYLIYWNILEIVMIVIINLFQIYVIRNLIFKKQMF
jgi:hypothetical protein